MLAATYKLTTPFSTLHEYPTDVSREFGLGLLDIQKNVDTITSEALTNYSDVHNQIFPEFKNSLETAMESVEIIFNKGYVFDLNGDFGAYKEQLKSGIERVSKTLEYFEPEKYESRHTTVHVDRIFKSQSEKIPDDVSYKVTGNTILIYPSTLDSMTNDIFKISQIVRPLVITMPYRPKDGLWSMFDELKPVDYVLSTLNDVKAVEQIYHAAKNLGGICDEIIDNAKDLRADETLDGK